MQSKCKHFDYGFTAPREYGAFCTVEAQAVSITSSDCINCKKFKPRLTAFEQWLANIQLTPDAELECLLRKAFEAGRKSATKF